ncbi:SRPBCC family protein [Lacisediminihabitans profunda]|uniref:SRPBCC family protein n=1 Tax=Lacisediminihabitans profunda TaxID=2594790 RepID=A0A5C8UN96_9MICO|nr:SRPBCC family protein [Lacisediminihabitans profunda]TXN29703.1 SRPBCC family protein [Lacisediminihabitans profunda]
MTNPTTITAQPGTPFLDIVREFDAPREKVYRAYTDAALVTQWMGPRRLSMDLTSWDVRPGGSWGFFNRDADGTEYQFHGVFHAVTPGEHILWTFEFDGAPGHVSLESIDFDDLGSRSRVRIHAVYQSVEDRDAMAAGGMESGVTEGFERMDELLQSVSAR